MRIRMFLFTGILLIIFGMLLAACSSKGGGNATQASGTTIDGATLVATRCMRCHAMSRITSAHKTADQWTTTVTRMINHGAQLTPDEEKVLLDYLAKTYGP